MAKQTFVECDAKNGMFSDEAVAVVGSRAYIVPRSKFRGDLGPKARLSVKTVVRDGKIWIVIPSEYSEVLPKTADVMLVEEED